VYNNNNNNNNRQWSLQLKADQLRTSKNNWCLWGLQKRISALPMVLVAWEKDRCVWMVGICSSDASVINVCQWSHCSASTTAQAPGSSSCRSLREHWHAVSGWCECNIVSLINTVCLTAGLLGEGQKPHNITLHVSLGVWGWVCACTWLSKQTEWMVEILG